MARKQARRKRRVKKKAVSRPPLPRIPFAAIGTLALAVAALVAVFEVSGYLLDRPVRYLDLEAPLQRVTDMQIQAAIEPEMQTGFLSADLHAIRRRLESLEWVDVAIVRRRWPDRLQILVSEQVPAARWQGTGLLNTKGELFVKDARHIPAELPRLAGPPGSASLVASRYLAMRGPLIERGLGLKSVDLDARGSWSLVLTNGVEVRLGRRDVERRALRFVEIATDLVAQREEDIAFVDMRYANGFSIGWKNDDYRERPIEDPELRPVLAAERSVQ